MERSGALKCRVGKTETEAGIALRCVGEGNGRRNRGGGGKGRGEGERERKMRVLIDKVKGLVNVG